MSDPNVEGEQSKLDRRAMVKRMAVGAFAVPAIVSFQLDSLARAGTFSGHKKHPKQTCPNQTHPNQTEPNQTHPNQPHPKPPKPPKPPKHHKDKKEKKPPPPHKKKKKHK